MILILSNNDDASTTYVIKWLIYYKKKFIRINAQDKVEFSFAGKEILFNVNDKIFKLSEIKSFWYRRGFFNLKETETIEIKKIEEFKKQEFSSFIMLIYYKLSKIKGINTIFNVDVNKLIVSDIAKELGIKTPDDNIFSNKECLTNKLESVNEEYITKTVSGNCMYSFDNFIIYNYTTNIDLRLIKTEVFFPSLVQNKIDKIYELRIFYLHGKFSTMAIFSQKDDQTSVDFRNYNDIKPNRNVPFKLPLKIEVKLDLLMKKLKLNCGSIDMIVTPEKKYVFLEVNPVGQFGMTSYPCNYNLEKKIAEYL